MHRYTRLLKLELYSLKMEHWMQTAIFRPRLHWVISPDCRLVVCTYTVNPLKYMILKTQDLHKRQTHSTLD